MLVDWKHGSLIAIEEDYRQILRDIIDNGEVKNPEYYEQFLSNSSFVYLGELPQMEGHIICAGKDGKVYFGFHDDDFRVLTEEEV